MIDRPTFTASPIIADNKTQPPTASTGERFVTPRTNRSTIESTEPTANNKVSLHEHNQTNQLSAQTNNQKVSLSLEVRFIRKALTLLDEIDEIKPKDVHSAKKAIVQNKIDEAAANEACHQLASNMINFNDEQQEANQLFYRQKAEPTSTQ